MGCGGSSGPAQTPLQTVQIAALLPVTGGGPINGKAERAAVELAVEDVNAHLAGIGSSTRVEAVIYDTQSSLDEEFRLITEVGNKKYPFAVFSATSNTLSLLKSQVDATGAIVLNEASTTPSLAIDDNLFRLVPEDRYSARVISDLLRENGIEKVVFYYRDDTWGLTLQQELASAFTAAGGAVADSIVYGFRTYPVDMDEKVAQLDASITLALGGTPAAKVAVVLLAFDEGVEILQKAAAYPTLATVKWYTGDGLGQNSALLQDAAAAAFASQVGLYAPLIAEANSATYAALKARIQAKSGSAYSFAPVMYDALWLAALTLAEAGGGAGPAVLKTTLIAKAAGYSAVTGPLVFNNAGDRSACAYDFWAVGYWGGAYHWVKAYSGRTR